jgi:4-hydroxy-3-methylbut-2-enyl diphosphate reductase IspH
MFLIIDVKDGVKGYINLGNDLSQAQDLLNMVENNLVFVKDSYSSFEKIQATCSVEVTKEIVLKKEGYQEKYENIVIGSDLDKEYIGTLSEPIECEHNLKAIQGYYMNKIAKLNSELATKNTTIQHLENTVEDLRDRLAETEV